MASEETLAGVRNYLLNIYMFEKVPELEYLAYKMMIGCDADE